MIQYCMMRIVQVIETVKQNSLKKLFKEIIYFNREAVPVAIDLSDLRPMTDFVQQSDEKLIEIKPNMISAGALNYPVKSRALKAANYLKSGFRGFAMVSGDEVSGDIWCATARNAEDGRVHPDEEWLDIRCGENEVYSFDMYVNPDKRGYNIAAALQNGALHQLKRQGFKRVYGFFWVDNIAALWVHRTLRWKELERVRASRFIFSRKFKAAKERV